MHFRTHLLSSLALGATLYRRQPLGAVLLTVSGTLIDLDHLVLYSLRTGDWSVGGALRYNLYRHLPLGAGDTRPRYGSLRSSLHNPLLVLPPLWWLARGRPLVRAAALGLSLHLLLDHLEWLPHRWAIWRAGHCCEYCGRRYRRLHARRLRRQRRYQVLCYSCGLRARRPATPAV